MNSIHPCWCGQTELADFSPEYSLCEKCQTLVLKNWPPTERFNVVDDATDFYGRSYYETHLSQAYGYPDLGERARSDLNERCMHWMRTLLKYRLPPARTVELGCAHGGFVALMRLAGFDATGLELSPWLVDYAKSAFGVPMLTGPIEEQNIEPGSLDIILHFDVLEHLPDPRGTMQRCMELLKPDGFIMVQTPWFRADRSYQEMVENHDPFLEQFKPAEHLRLFSRASITQLFSGVGAPFVYFEPAIFHHYDMFLVASARELTSHTEEEITSALLNRPEGRIVQALLDANAQHVELARRYAEIDADREARLRLLQDAEVRMREADGQLKQLANEAETQLGRLQTARDGLERALLKLDDSYRVQMSHRLARLLRRLQGSLKMDDLYKAMEERVTSNSVANGENEPGPRVEL
jgi:2-polyprenyl-3-methyl-5-hydroxy-6-metoxy-1,4-benzoquinol methylase